MSKHPRARTYSPSVWRRDVSAYNKPRNTVHAFTYLHARALSMWAKLLPHEFENLLDLISTAIASTQLNSRKNEEDETTQARDSVAKTYLPFWVVTSRKVQQMNFGGFRGHKPGFWFAFNPHIVYTHYCIHSIHTCPSNTRMCLLYYSSTHTPTHTHTHTQQSSARSQTRTLIHKKVELLCVESIKRIDRNHCFQQGKKHKLLVVVVLMVLWCCWPPQWHGDNYSHIYHRRHEKANFTCR